MIRAQPGIKKLIKNKLYTVTTNYIVKEYYLSYYK